MNTLTARGQSESETFLKAHKIANFLTILELSVEWLERELAQTNPNFEAVKSQVQDIRKEIDRL